MTKDVIVLTKRMPDPWIILAGLLAGGPDLHVQRAGDDAVIQLCDEQGRPLLSVETPFLARVPGEAARLLGPEAPAQDGPVWWTEARASTAVKEAEQLAGVFAGRLAHLLGGTVWPPDAVPATGVGAPVPTAGITAAPAPAAAQPAVDVLTDRVAVAIQDRPVIAMTTWLSDALAAALASDRGLQIVTPSHARLTLPTRSLLTGTPSRWVVQDGTGGYYDGLSGAVLHWRDGAFTPVDAPDDAPEDGTPVAKTFTEFATTGERQLLLSLRARHPAEHQLVLGGALETALRTLTGAPPAGWGTAEPTSLPWSRRQLTDFAHTRSPDPTWTVVVGAPDSRPAIATLTVSRTTGGVEENMTLAVGYNQDETPPLDELPTLTDRLIREDRLVSMLAQVRSARRDLTAPAHFEPPPIPVAFALGPEDAHDIGPTHARHTPLPTRPIELGPPARPGFYYQLGDGTSGTAWTALEQLVRHLRAQ
ncbi:DUF6177 family protein [Streptomyces sp. SAJ15]|uniref:DUF6177 family protein n=1 Tax=Streptomyces sp. SAJ15 TaxID=2011095 RepID=UPI0011858950|nr:DUF6177 family protein [Streptomyces sp. SAJ15]TVL90448.1 hypothetical protein CD790_20915 [Streptomyces sp. SAJ15]